MVYKFFVKTERELWEEELARLNDSREKKIDTQSKIVALFRARARRADSSAFKNYILICILLSFAIALIIVMAFFEINQMALAMEAKKGSNRLEQSLSRSETARKEADEAVRAIARSAEDLRLDAERKRKEAEIAKEIYDNFQTIMKEEKQIDTEDKKNIAKQKNLGLKAKFIGNLKARVKRAKQELKKAQDELKIKDAAAKSTSALAQDDSKKKGIEGLMTVFVTSMASSMKQDVERAKERVKRAKEEEQKAIEILKKAEKKMQTAKTQSSGEAREKSWKLTTDDLTAAENSLSQALEEASEAEELARKATLEERQVKDARSILLQTEQIIHSALKEANEENPDRYLSNWPTYFGRITAVALILFLVQIFNSIYRYHKRLSGFYNGRADALELKDSDSTDLSKLAETLSPNYINFGRELKSPIKTGMDIAGKNNK